MTEYKSGCREARIEKAGGLIMWRVWYLKHRVREILENKDGVGVVEIILILVGILTPYYGVSIKCIT